MLAKIGNREFRLTLSPLPGNRLPKRSPDLPIILNGNSVTAKVTSSRGFAAEGKTVEYIWLPIFPNKCYYLALDYAESAATLAGADVTTADGTASRPDPERIPRDAEAEKRRIALFGETYRANRAAAESAKA